MVSPPPSPTNQPHSVYTPLSPHPLFVAANFLISLVIHPLVPLPRFLCRLPPPLPQVKICTGGSTTDCVTSRANSYPVVNLREGITMLSHIDGTT